MMPNVSSRRLYLNYDRFDTNYHYVVPELSQSTQFKLNHNKPLEEYNEAKSLGIDTRPVLLGPVSYLFLAKAARDAPADFQTISLLSKLVPLYTEILSQLKNAGAAWVQIDEPILVLDSALQYQSEFTHVYAELEKVAPRIMLTTYFGRLEENLKFVSKLSISGLHVDLDREPKQLDSVIAALKQTHITLSLGYISGRAVWKNEFSTTVANVQKAIDALTAERVIVATSSSLLHIPVTLASETQLTAEQKDWFSFALEKAEEVATVAAILSGSQAADVASALEKNKSSIEKRRQFEKNSDDSVRKRVASISPKMLERQNPYPVRREAQKKHLQLPKFPTTTIGSFPVSFHLSLTNKTNDHNSKRKKFGLLELD